MYLIFFLEWERKVGEILKRVGIVFIFGFNFGLVLYLDVLFILCGYYFEVFYYKFYFFFSYV